MLTGPAPQAAPPADVDPAHAGLLGQWREAIGDPAAPGGVPFLAAGGHSLAAMRLVAFVHATDGVRLSVRDIMRARDVGELAELVGSGAR
jgi:hypothetical protein